MYYNIVDSRVVAIIVLLVVVCSSVVVVGGLGFTHDMGIFVHGLI